VLGVPRTLGRHSTGERADQHLTAREALAFRAANRRTMRATTGVMAITATVCAALFGAGTVLLFPRAAPILVVAAIQIMVAVSAFVLSRGRRRLPPLPIAFTLALSAAATVLSMVVFVPDTRFVSLLLLAMFPPTMVLFLPWSVRVQALWLLAAAALLAIATGLLSAALPAPEWIGVWVASATSGLVSLVGGVLASRLRRGVFALHMQARRANAMTVAREAELRRLNGELARASRTDPLTGLGNRLRMDAELTAAAARSTRYGNDCTIVMFDLDRFKDYNHALGHVAGDAALQSVAAAMAGSVRAVDIICRFGGEEFVVLMPEQSLEGGARGAERIRRAVEALQLHHPTPNGPQVLTISAGIALLGRGQANDEDGILRAADAALYRAKRAGRNRIAGAPFSAAGKVDDEQLRVGAVR